MMEPTCDLSPVLPQEADIGDVFRELRALVDATGKEERAMYRGWVVRCAPGWSGVVRASVGSAKG